tara:strand:+ start:497 stop:877 length:381 start_codon:yes stop_codon:yes gene_type:complete
MRLNSALIVPMLIIISGCASDYKPRQTIIDEQKQEREFLKPAPQSVLERQAYEKGVQDVLIDMKGKMRARERFTWEAPNIQCGTQIPGRVVNGMLIPAHEECVQIAPGRWTEEAPTFLPLLGSGHE